MKVNRRQQPALSDLLHYLVLPICILLLALYGEPLFALGPPDITVQHLQNLWFTAQQSLTLETSISDPVGIIAARCYFRYQPSGDYVYVELDRAGGDVYRAVLPAPAAAVEKVEYFFLAVNEAQQVVRSPSYAVRGRVDDHSGGEVPQQGVIRINAEGAPPENLARSLANPGEVQVVPAPASEWFGPVVGVNQAAGFPGTTHVEGYFGGFRLDAEGNSFPVKGAAAMPPSVSGLSSITAATAVEEQAVKEQAQAEVVCPNIAGEGWWGVRYIDDDGQHSIPKSLTASITQVDCEVTIVTSLSVFRPRMLVGTINADGHMLLYDEINEDWSTHYGPATVTELTIADFTHPPSAEDPYPPLLVVELRRLDSDGDGIPDELDACPDQGDLGFGIGSAGCALPPPSLPAVLHLLLPEANQ